MVAARLVLRYGIPVGSIGILCLVLMTRMSNRDLNSYEPSSLVSDKFGGSSLEALLYESGSDESTDVDLNAMLQLVRPGGYYIIGNVEYDHRGDPHSFPFMGGPGVLLNTTVDTLEHNHAFFADTAIGRDKWLQETKPGGWAVDRTARNSSLVVLQKRTEPLRPVDVHFGKVAMKTVTLPQAMVLEPPNAPTAPVLVTELPLSCHAKRGSAGWLWPQCEQCIPGLIGDDCATMANDVKPLRNTLQKLAEQRYGARGAGGHLYPYLELPEYQQRQKLVTKLLTGIKPLRVLDLGAYFNPIEKFADFSSGWCPETIISVDPIYNGSSTGILCGGGRKTSTITYVPMTVKQALRDPVITSMKFDAIVCVGCDEQFGPSLAELEGFPRPYYLALESIPDFKTFMRAPTAQRAQVIFHQEWNMKSPPEGTYYGYVYSRRYLA